MKKLILVLSMAAVAAAGYSQAIISDGTSTFGWSSASALSGDHTSTTAGSNNVFTVNGSADQAFQEWWYYRANGVNSREFSLSNQSAGPLVSGNHMTLSYAEAEGFSSSIMYTINNIGSKALVTGTNFITNTRTSGDLDLDFFNYIDYDMGGSASGDSAFLLSGNPALRMRIIDSSSLINAEYRALDADNYQVTGFSTLRGNLTDADADNMNNTGAPFVNGDFTGGVQWHFTLAPGQQIALQTSRVLNTVPEPATMAALGVGVVALLRRRRK